MNNTKIAVIFTDKKEAIDYYQLNNGILQSLNLLGKNFDIEVFALTSEMNTIIRPRYEISFRNTYKALDFAINKRFEPDVVILVGSTNFPYERILNDKYKKKILIHKGNFYNKKVEGYFDHIIVETAEEEKEYKNSISASVVNTRIFRPQQTEKYFSVCYPQQISDNRIDFFENIRFYGSISQHLNSTVKLPFHSSEILSTIMNQSKAVSIIEDIDSVELALSALACNTPVIVTNDTKASKLPAVIKANATTPDFINETYKALELRYNFFEEYIKPNYTPERFAKLLMELI